MIVERKTALKLWEELYDKNVEATDFTGRKMNKSAYDQRNSKYGWCITCILPRSAGGKADDPSNMICVHTDTAQEKGEDYPIFVAADKRYEISYEIESEEWIIEQLFDSESIAQAQKKSEEAALVWESSFGEAEIATDFAGRQMHKSEFCTDSEYAWKLAPYVSEKPMENNNVYAANVLTVEEAFGKTAFKASGKNFTLNKENGTYRFREIEIKPQKKEFDVKNPYDVARKIEQIVENCDGGDNVMLDLLLIKAASERSLSAASRQCVTETVISVLNDCGCDQMGCEVSESVDEIGKRYIHIAIRFLAKTPVDFERVVIGAETLNTYAALIMPKFELSEFKIYNHAEFVGRAHTRFSIGQLCAYYPQIAAFMEGVFASTSGFYYGEAPSTLYISNMIIVNVPFLLEMHPQESEQFYTPVYLAEHNYPDLILLGKIQGVLSGKSEGGTAKEQEIPETTENIELIEPVTEENVEETEDLQDALDEAVDLEDEPQEDPCDESSDLNEGEQLTFTNDDPDQAEDDVFTLELDSFN